MNARALKFVSYDRVQDHLREGWMASIPNAPMHHHFYGCEMVFLCDCPITFSDPGEEWRDIPGFEGEYQVSDLGNVRGLDRVLVKPDAIRGYPRTVKGQVLKAGDVNGYLAVSLGGKPHYVHQLVALAFIGQRPNGLEVCHNNGIKTQNFPENIRYGTPLENTSDKFKHGTMASGEKISRLKEDEVRAIRRRATYQPVKEIATAFGISPTTVAQIISGARWKHLPLHAGEAGTPEGDALRSANCGLR